MKIVAEFTDYNLNDNEDIGDEEELEQECSTPGEAVSFVTSRVDYLTPDGHQVALTGIFFCVGDERLYLEEVAEEAGDDDYADAVSGGYLSDMDIDVEHMARWLEAAERLASQAD